MGISRNRAPACLAEIFLTGSPQKSGLAWTSPPTSTLRMCEKHDCDAQNPYLDCCTTVQVPGPHVEFRVYSPFDVMKCIAT